jgi:hypothetical protein
VEATYLHINRFVRIIKFLILASVTSYGLLSRIANGQEKRYVNPLSIEDSRSVADPTVLHFQGKYYLFLSGGIVWVSDDLVAWRHEHVTMPSGQRAKRF